MAKLVHYTCTVQLPGLVDCVCKFMTETLGPMGGATWKAMGLKFDPVMGRCLLHHSNMFGPMSGTSESHG